MQQYSKYYGGISQPMNWKKALILFGAAILSLGIYIYWSSLVYRIGYPLDDAWIHQTFARNLARYHELSYFQGIPSAGSTAPLWSAILAIGYFFSRSNYVWTMFLGLAGLFFLGLLTEWIFPKITTDYNFAIPWVGILLILEWHLVWAAASGMETMLFAVILLAVFALLLRKNPPWLVLGLIIGLGIWVRPDAITLLGPVGLILGIGIWQRKYRWIDLARFVSSFILTAIPYLILNYSITGNLWPNTFFAKQQEYAQLLANPITSRFFNVFKQHLVGKGILLFPGFLYQIWRSIREKNWLILAFSIWWFGFLLLYALRLPVDYQHGRYEIPAMPVYFLISGAGVFTLWQAGRKTLRRRVLVNAWVLSILLINLGFFFLGGRSYATDVAIIESEMVDTAKWINQNTPDNATIAAHDIGALGFYGHRKILDLAGLISPEVIPFIRDEAKLDEFIHDSGAKFLMTFPGWYPSLSQKYPLVFQTGGDFSRAAGGENMVVYRIDQTR
jgi:hypothetical protein